MTVAELIAKLQTFDPTTLVVAGGFDEGGFDDIETVKVVELSPIVQVSHGAAYEETCNLHHYDKVIGPSFTAVYVDR